MEILVSSEWLAEEIGANDLVVLDASAHLPDAQRDAAEEYAAAHIPGALFLSMGNFSNPDSPVPSAIPTRAQFEARLGELGISDSHRVVIYDDSAVRTSARAWFLFRLYGLDRAAILDGGLEAWRAAGRELESGSANGAATQLSSEGGVGEVCFKADVLANIESQAAQLVDARGPARFTGEEGDYRPGVASGHIPGAKNLPYGKVFKEDGTYKEPADILRAFLDAGIDPDQPIITTCGSGVTAAVLIFALLLTGRDTAALYDGSWSEWGADPDMPKALGEAG